MSATDYSDHRRILVLHPGALGDLLLSLPALRDLKKLGPVSLSVAGPFSALAILADAREIDSPISFDAGWLAELFAPGADLSPDVDQRLRHYDLIISWAGDGGGALSRRMAGFPKIVYRADDPVRSDADGSPRWVRYRRALEEITGGGKADHSPIHLGRKALLRGVERLRRESLDPASRIIALHPGAGGRGKRWGLEGFEAIGRFALGHGAAVVVLEGPAEPGLGAVLAKRLGERARVIAPGDPLELAGVLATCHVAVGNDSGPAHLAAALGIRTVVMYLSTDPGVWLPWGPSIVPIIGSGDGDRAVAEAVAALGIVGQSAS